MESEDITKKVIARDIIIPIPLRSRPMPKPIKTNLSDEKRYQHRKPELKNHRIEIKLLGEPIYQFKLTDVSPRGAGLVVNKTSRFLELAEVGQVLDANFLSPRGAEPSGRYRIEVRHITDTDHGHYKGVRRVGVRILERLKTS